MTEIDESILTHQRQAARALAAMTREREERQLYDLVLAEGLERVRASTHEVRTLLAGGGATAPQDIETWLAKTDGHAGELALLAEAVALFRAEVEVEGYGAVRFVPALDGLARNFESDPERAAWAWDGARQLVGPLAAPRFAGVPEVAAALARYGTLATRVEAELGLRLASHRARGLVDEADELITQLQNAIDRADEEDVLRRRAALREALVRLPREPDLPEVRDLDARAATMFARSEAELGGHLVLIELERIERVLEPMVDQLERGLMTQSAARVVEHAPRVRATLPALAPYASHGRAQRLAQRASAALDRIAAELGDACARDAVAADAVPRFADDPAASSRVQAVVRALDKLLAEYREAHLAAQVRFEADVDLVDGTAQAATDRVVDRVASTAGELVRGARRAEALAGELAALDPAHPAIAAVAAATPVLIRRVQAWKARIATLCAYANAIDDARRSTERAREGCDAAALEWPGRAVGIWSNVLGWLATAEGDLDAAAKVLPAERERGDGWRAKVAELRRRATEQLAAVCVAEATRHATRNDMDEARRFAKVLADAVPAAVENQQIAAMLDGTADARVRAAIEIERHGALIRSAAETAARAARPAYEAWVAERPPLVALAGAIVANLDAYRGRFIAGRCSHLGLALADEPDTIRGDVYQIDYDPEVRRHLAEGMARLDGMFASRAEQTAAAAGVAGLCTTTQHYPSDAHYHAEIVGLASYTPIHEVRDVHGSLVRTYAGAPYPVPRIAIRAVATRYFVIVPGEPPSLDAMVTASAG